MTCFFRHNWRVVKTQVLPSMLEQISNLDASPRIRNFTKEPAAHEVVVEYRCETCGRGKVRVLNKG